ncbi:MAG: SRPBCC domain-containing protein [Anaerolineaceae bacterium]|nr:SRPBCC domain-containing protein [Anaerolineaceae bacterium]
MLTLRSYTAQWAPEFASGDPHFYIESDWKLGSPVLWKGQDDSSIVEGMVTAIVLNKLLHFTVFDVRSEKPLVTEEDGITYKLSEQNGITTLHLRQGDFSSMPEGAKYRDMSLAVWQRVLPKVKELAEKA